MMKQIYERKWRERHVILFSRRPVAVRVGWGRVQSHSFTPSNHLASHNPSIPQCQKGIFKAKMTRNSEMAHTMNSTAKLFAHSQNFSTMT
jgi:hypothetical protein